MINAIKTRDIVSFYPTNITIIITGCERQSISKLYFLEKMVNTSFCHNVSFSTIVRALILCVDFVVPVHNT